MINWLEIEEVEEKDGATEFAVSLQADDMPKSAVDIAKSLDGEEFDEYGFKVLIKYNKPLLETNGTYKLIRQCDDSDVAYLDNQNYDFNSVHIELTEEDIAEIIKACKVTAKQMREEN